MEFSHEMIICIVNNGFSIEVMDAARSAGARGGTVINARGTAGKEAEKLFNISIQPEKELVMILTGREKRNQIMTAICKDAGIDKEGMGISFSLPVDAVAGIRALAKKEDSDEPKEND